MDLKEFRLMHSELVEHYQFIEFHLEGICATLYGGSFSEGLDRVDRHSIARLMQELRRLEKMRSEPVLSEEEWQELEQINARRNFWCHECYVDLVFDIKTGGLKNIADLRRMLDDRNRASRLRSLLYDRKIALLSVSKKGVIANQSADWCGNPLTL